MILQNPFKVSHKTRVLHLSEHSVFSRIPGQVAGLGLETQDTTLSVPQNALPTRGPWALGLDGTQLGPHRTCT